MSTPIGQRPEFERVSRTQIVLWCVAGYVIYVAMCLAIESYGRHRFGVQRRIEIERIVERKPRLLAETRRANALTELEEWFPYQVMMAMSLIGWGILGLAIGGVTLRALIRSRRNRGLLVPIRFLALVVMLPTAAVFVAGVLPPLLARTLWETQFWLTWPT